MKQLHWRFLEVKFFLRMCKRKVHTQFSWSSTIIVTTTAREEPIYVGIANTSIGLYNFEESDENQFPFGETCKGQTVVLNAAHNILQLVAVRVRVYAVGLDKQIFLLQHRLLFYFNQSPGATFRLIVTRGDEDRKVQCNKKAQNDFGAGTAEN